MNQTYTVKAGDTLYGISNQYGVSVTELARLNNVTAQTLKVGQVLTIPSNTGTNPNNMFMYTVKQGDSLYSISKKYNTTVQALVDLNNLKTTSLSIGQVLRIPETYTKEEDMVMPNYTNYTVKKGDTLYSIARDNNIDVNTLMKDNAITNNNLKIGQTIRIRTNVIEVEDECFGPDYTPPERDVDTINYIVKKGDNLYNIAKNYNTTASVIQNLNNLTTTNLSIGQVLKIPSTSSSNRVYIVKSGDSLYSIARSFNTTVDDIKRKNNITSNVINVGQRLIV